MSATLTTTAVAEPLAVELHRLPLAEFGKPERPANPRTLGGRISRSSIAAGITNDDTVETTTGRDQEAALPPGSASRLRVTLSILQPSLVNLLVSFTNGIVIVGLPAIARDVSLPRSLYLWPSSVFGLASGSMLLVAGAAADVIGPRRVELAGVLLMGVFTLACGLAATGGQLVAFRALQGLAMSLHLPSSVALVAAAVPRGRARNVGFACLGLSQLLGFMVGLVLAGVLVERAGAGWRAGFYAPGALELAAAVAGYFTFPDVKPASETTRGHHRGVAGVLGQLYAEIDWVGGLIASGGLALLSYVLATLSAELATIGSAVTATLLALSVALLVAFPLWMHHRTLRGKPALVPNALWRNVPFASICLLVALSSGALNASEIFHSLYFQEVQGHSSTATSLLMLPQVVVGVALNLTTGLFVHRFSARWLISVTSVLCAASPLMMAVLDPAWSYWRLQFWAQILAPLSIDVLYTVGLIVISECFPEKTQALAGAVFNTVAQFGFSLGVGVCQVVALGVAGKVETDSHVDGAAGGGEHVDNDADMLLKGYRASFWTMFTLYGICGLIALFGLKKAGKVGSKQE